MEEHGTFYLEFIKSWMAMFIKMSHISNNFAPERLDNKQFAPPIHPRFEMFHSKKNGPKLVICYLNKDSGQSLLEYNSYLSKWKTAANWGGGALKDTKSVIWEAAIFAKTSAQRFASLKH